MSTQWVEPFSAPFLADPHPAYEALRRDEPVRPVVMPSGERAWLITRFEDVRRGLTDPRLSNDQTRLSIARPFDALPAEVGQARNKDLLNIDPPVHGRLRAIVAETFTVAAAERFRGPLERIAAGLLDRLSGRTAIDIVADYATPFITAATTELLGIPPQMQEPFAGWLHQIASVILKDHDQIEQPAIDLHEFVGNLAEAKRANPGDDLLTELTGAHRDGLLADDEFTSMIHLLLVAAQEGPVNLISTGVFLLLAHPGQRARLQADPGLLPSAVDEFVRYQSPLGLAIYRNADVPVTYSGVTIPAGEPILFSLISANRDGERFACPHLLDIGRAERNHLGFGWGRHYCLGAPLGRVEAQVAIGALFARFPDLALAITPDEAGWRPSVITRGLSTLPVTLR